MYAFGYKGSARPKSIPSNTVFRRCAQVVEGFTQNEVEFCIALIERRNEELHTGSTAFDDFPTKVWLSDFYRVCETLLKSFGKSLADLLGADEAVAARTMMAKVEKELLGRVKRAIAEAKTKYSKLDESDRKLHWIELAHEADDPPEGYPQTTTCPACEQETAILTGELVKASDAKLEEDVIAQEFVVLPTHLYCVMCGLDLNSHAELVAADSGGQYSVKREYEPQEFYADNFDPSELYEPEYGND